MIGAVFLLPAVAAFGFLVVLAVPALVALVAAVLVAAAVAAITLTGRVVLRRPWRVEAASQTERRVWRVHGFRPTGRRSDEFARRVPTRPEPPAARITRPATLTP